VIRSFKNKATEHVWNQKFVKGFPAELHRIALKRLYHLHSATSLLDLRLPPGNRLHALTGDRAGQHSISINMQYRICFRWDDGHAFDVEIVDYH